MATRFKRNLIASVVAQLIRYGAPLAFYPYLTRTLGAEGFAEFALAFAAAVMLGQVIEFGFGLSGVRSLAAGKLSAPNIASDVVGQTIIGRTITSSMVVAIALVIILMPTNMFHVSPLLMLGVFAIAINYGFSPAWYFIGEESSSHLAAIEVATSFSQLCLIVITINSDSPPYLAIFCLAAPMTVASVYGNFMAISRLGFSMPNREKVLAALKESFALFCFTGLMPIMNRANLIILGALSTPTQVAWYAVGERVVTAAVNASTPVIRVVMPRVTRLLSEDSQAAEKIFNHTTYIMLAASTLLALFGAMSGPWFLPSVFGAALDGAALVFGVQIFTIPLMLTSKNIATIGLVPLRLETSYQKLVMGFGIVGLILAPAAALLGGALGLSIARVAIEIGLLVSAFMLLRRHRLDWVRSNQT